MNGGIKQAFATSLGTFAVPTVLWDVGDQARIEHALAIVRRIKATIEVGPKPTLTLVANSQNPHSSTEASCIKSWIPRGGRQFATSHHDLQSPPRMNMWYNSSHAAGPEVV